MDTVMQWICLPLGWLMKLCWGILSDYGLSIILFTLFTKFVLLPLSVWVHTNSIKMVQLQPDINFIKAEYYGNREKIEDEQAALYKKKKYNPFISIIPLAVQVILLMGVVEIIYHPLTYIIGMSADTVKELAAWAGADLSTSSYELDIVGKITGLGAMPTDFIIGAEDFEEVNRIGSPFCSFFILSEIPVKTWGLNTVVPVLAGLSAYILCFSQNVMNVLQHEQGKLSKYGMTAFSVALSLYLGFFVPAGIALYWIASNLFAILQLVILNLCINPKKRVDYDALEKSRAKLAEIEALDGGGKKGKKTPQDKQNSRREKADYKRFFGIVNKHIVIYSERGGFYKYFEALINGLLSRSNVVIHYITNDPDDPVFEKSAKEPRIKPYYIGIKKLIPMMMKMDADMVIMTTPDLEKYYIKRSLVRKDIEYIYIPHDTMSTHMGFREGALDNFDTVFCAGPHIEREIRATEAEYKLPAKELVRYGYPLIEKLIAAGNAEREKRAEEPANGFRDILIAPSWQEDNLLDSCLDTLLEQLDCPGYRVTVRPHPEYMKRYPDKIRAITERYKDRVGERLAFELDFTANKSVYSSDLLITDWSGISVEFCFATKRPALFINTKMKSPNPNWQRIGLTPVEISLRNEMGVALEKSELGKTRETVDALLSRAPEYYDIITGILNGFLFNIGDNGKAGVSYILTRLAEKKKAGK